MTFINIGFILRFIFVGDSISKNYVVPTFKQFKTASWNWQRWVMDQTEL